MDIVFASTTQLASAIRKGHVSAIEVLQAHLAQIEAHNPTLNAVITLDAERAYERDQAGLPIGIQVVGKRWQESRLLAVAQALTEVTGEFQRPPGF